MKNDILVQAFARSDRLEVFPGEAVVVAAVVAPHVNTVVLIEKVVDIVHAQGGENLIHSFSGAAAGEFEWRAPGMFVGDIAKQQLKYLSW